MRRFFLIQTEFHSARQRNYSNVIVEILTVLSRGSILNARPNNRYLIEIENKLKLSNFLWTILQKLGKSLLDFDDEFYSTLSLSMEIRFIIPQRIRMPQPVKNLKQETQLIMLFSEILQPGLIQRLVESLKINESVYPPNGMIEIH